MSGGEEWEMEQRVPSALVPEGEGGFPKEMARSN